jgi:aspartate/methionine/tyrosine aminotransferase
VFGDMPHFSIGSLEELPKRIITLNGFGKSLGVTGWRIGYSCVPSSLTGKFNKLQQHINTNTSSVIQYAFDLAWPLPVEHLDEYNKKLAERANLYTQFLSDNPLLSGSMPKGSFFAFINISKSGIDSLEFASKLVEKTGVAVTAGIAFGKEWDDHFRISLAVDDIVLKEALNRISNFVKKGNGNKNITNAKVF